jgi:hypothetical protein
MAIPYGRHWNIRYLNATVFFNQSAAGWRCPSNIRLTRNTGREAIGAFCALKSEAIAQNVTKVLSRLKRLLVALFYFSCIISLTVSVTAFSETSIFTVSSFSYK